MSNLDVSKYRVDDERKIKLRDFDPDDDGGLTKEEGEAKLAKNLEKYEDLHQLLWANRSHALLVVLQGIDTAGKDGTIRKVFTAFNPQGVVVWSFKAPSSIEASHDYLWRIHFRCPPRGDIAVLNRSHYEDVLITRVHGTISKDETQQRYRQIRHFEQMLAEEDTVILKFFLTISKDEQLKRMRARLEDPAKQWKFSESDIKERGYWDSYTSAFEDMLSNTGAKKAPWYIVPSNRKWYRNLVVSQVVRAAMEDLKLGWPKPSIDLSKVVLE